MCTQNSLGVAVTGRISLHTTRPTLSQACQFTHVTVAVLILELQHVLGANGGAELVPCHVRCELRLGDLFVVLFAGKVVEL